MPTKICLFSDCPPIRDGATATYSVAWSLAKAMEECSGLLLTRRLHSSVSPKRIAVGINAPTHLIHDARRLGLIGFSEDLRAMIDCLLLLIQLPMLIPKIRRGNCSRIFMIGTNHWSCIAFALIMGRACRLPSELFLLDDLEASAIMQRKPYKARIARMVERILLPRLNRIWTISQGYADHLKTKYGVEAKYLPLVIRKSAATFQPYESDRTERIIGYSGGIHGLYAEPLKELIAEIRNRNLSGGHHYRLRIFTANAPLGLLDLFGGNDAIEVITGLDNQSLLNSLSQSYANFLPYSHSDEFRVMVTTAFSCKMTEYLVCGRPIIVYGPEYASVPRHFIKAGLPLVVTRKGEIAFLLDQIPLFDDLKLIQDYNKLIDTYHSPTAIRSALTESWEE